MIAYPAKIFYDHEDKIYNVRFQDFPGCITYGETLDEAKKMARDALTGVLEVLDSRKMIVPESSQLSEPDVYYIEPEINVAFAIWLKKERKKNGLTQSDIAKKLGISYQAYQRIENPAHTNPTLKTIHKLEEVFGKRLIEVNI